MKANLSYSFRALTIALAALGASTAVFADSPITIDVEPVFEGLTPTSGTFPIAVTFENNGPDAVGMLSVGELSYPVNLPRGSHKKLITYPVSQWGSVQFVFSSNQGLIRKEYRNDQPTSQDSGAIALISDTPGDLSFLQSSGSGSMGGQEAIRLHGVYCQPANAPDRPAGYRGIGAVMLGGGSERMTDEEVNALKSYALTGGTLVFLGGASSPILSDPRWQAFLPAHDFSAITLGTSAKLEALGDESVPSFTILDGKPIKGATANSDNGHLLSAERSIGLGRALYLSYNPLDSPLNKWPGRKAALLSMLKPTIFGSGTNLLGSYSRDTSNDPPVMYSAPGGRTYAIPSGVPMAPRPFEGTDDPFSTKLPPTEKVFGVLGAYFFVVVPLNFLILKKLKRGELAWITAPILSLGFAGALFSSAQNLYSQKMSTATQGLLVIQEGVDDGMFVGTSQMFVPRSGRYDLKLTGVDSLGAVDTDRYYYGSPFDQNDNSTLDAIDTGEVTVPDMPVNNLAFKEISFRQRFPVGSWFSIDAKRASKFVADVTVRNNSPYAVRDAYLMAAGQDYKIKDLEPGQTVTASIKHISGQPDSSGGLASFSARYGSVLLTGSLDGLRPGPQIGNEVAGRRRIEVAVFGKDMVGK